MGADICGFGHSSYTLRAFPLFANWHHCYAWFSWNSFCRGRKVLISIWSIQSRVSSTSEERHLSLFVCLAQRYSTRLQRLHSWPRDGLWAWGSCLGYPVPHVLRPPLISGSHDPASGPCRGHIFIFLPQLAEVWQERRVNGLRALLTWWRTRVSASASWASEGQFWGVFYRSSGRLCLG